MKFYVSADQGNVRQTKKETVLNHTGHAVKFHGQSGRISNLPEAAVEDVMSLISDKRLAGLAFPQLNRSAESPDASDQKCFCEGHYLHRQRKLSEHRDLLAGIGDDHYLAGSRSHDLFPQQSAAAALDQLQR